MNRSLTLAAALATCLSLSACSKDKPEAPSSTATPAASSTAPQQAPAAPQPAQASTVKPVASYIIPPFPVTGNQACDYLASETRRCLNQFGKTDQQRKTYEKLVNNLLDSAEVKPGDEPNQWASHGCKSALQSYAKKFPQCGIQP